MPDIDGHWDIVITSLQDICNLNESLSFDNLYGAKKEGLSKLSNDELLQLKEDILDHKSNIETAKRLLKTSKQNLSTLIDHVETTSAPPDEKARASTRSKTTSSKAAASKAKKKKLGRSFFTSKYNPLEPIVVGSEVAYKLRNRHFEEWIQCEVVKIIGDGIKFEIRDPEPDENNNPGQTFKANYKEILLIPRLEDLPDLGSYPYRTKVLARYPETTTFYPAVVVGEKRGIVRLQFDGEEEANKETEVERRLVLPFPER